MFILTPGRKLKIAFIPRGALNSLGKPFFEKFSSGPSKSYPGVFMS